MSRLLLHAPNVHTGGGLVLLQDLLNVPELPLAFANLDARAVAHVRVLTNAAIHAVAPSVAARLRAEFRLRDASRPGDTILCFHGMPPLLPQRGKTVVFLQNRNYLGLDPLSLFQGRTRIRLAFERFVCRAFQRNADEYVVQTTSMERATRAWHGRNPVIRVIPFLDLHRDTSAERSDAVRDFIYAADGEAHKNHRNLLAAWILLAEKGLQPSLGLTLNPRFHDLLREIDSAKSRYVLRIDNLGIVPRKELMREYKASRALIFPSLGESFGMPLIEAAEAGIPIVASELDYVRDVCDPVQTFDPNSPVSIARAVRRHLGSPEQRSAVVAAPTFLREILR